MPDVNGTSRLKNADLKDIVAQTSKRFEAKFDYHSHIRDSNLKKVYETISNCSDWKTQGIDADTTRQIATEYKHTFVACPNRETRSLQRDDLNQLTIRMVRLVRKFGSEWHERVELEPSEYVISHARCLGKYLPKPEKPECRLRTFNERRLKYFLLETQN
jgi:hypothetical protein